MLATLGDALVAGAGWAFEPKYDGVRALLAIDPRPRTTRVALWSRNGNDKTAQFPEIADAAVVAGRHPALATAPVGNHARRS
jgi:bifunctional non-homologous end joining protein LigD